MQEKIINFLKLKNGHVSGEEISHHLKISRQALWKHIQQLKDSGYDIAAVPHLGYRFISSPDRLFVSEVRHQLNTEFIGKKIYYFDSVPSTMDIAAELGMKGAVEGTLVLSETQSKGKGRLGREWFSPKYKGIYLSLILKPKLSPNLSPILTLLCAVGMCEAINRFSGLDAKIKWPNDILINNKKVGGMLTELNAEVDIIRFVIIGIGLNVNNDKDTLVSHAASLKEQAKEEKNINRVELLQEILRRIEMSYLLFQEKGSQSIIGKWRNYSITLGRRIRVTYEKKQLEGIAIDVDIDGGLILRKDSGLTQKVMAGDIVHCR